MATDTPTPIPTPRFNTNPVVRFRIRSLLAVTSALAVLAAIAGPYYRSQPPAAQPKLLIMWGCILACSAVAMWLHWRMAWNIPPGVGQVRFLLWNARGRYSPLRMWTGHALVAVICLVAVWACSRGLVREVARSSASLWMPVWQGCYFGLMTGGALIAMVRRPAFLGDGGVASAQGIGPWKYIRHAEWLAEQPGVLKFRRLDGDIYVDVPATLRDEVEAFVRGKTTLVASAGDAAAHGGGGG